MLKNEHCRRQCSFLKVYVDISAFALTPSVNYLNIVLFTTHIIMAQCAFCQVKTAFGAIIIHMINLKDIQARLREEIKSSNLTQKEIAEKLGINPSTVSKYVRLDKFPAIDTFANLCEILDVSSDEILGLKK